MVNQAAIVTVRNSSKRLPDKLLKQIKGDIKAIDIIIERAKKTNFSVIIATSTSTEDNIFEEIAKNHKVKIFRGALTNKIKRWYDCFQKFDLDRSILIDGDDLSYDFDIGNRALNQLDFQTELIIHPKDIVCGFFTYAISREGISKLYKIVSNKDADTDVITKYLEKARLKTKYITLKEHEKNQRVRLTLDYSEDLEFFRKMYQELDIKASGEEIIKYLNEHKSIAMINFHRQKDFLNNQAKFNQSVI